MILVKYRMLYDNGCIETLDEQEAIQHGNYIIVEEEVVVVEQIPIIYE